MIENALLTGDELLPPESDRLEAHRDGVQIQMLDNNTLLLSGGTGLAKVFVGQDHWHNENIVVRIKVKKFMESIAQGRNPEHVERYAIVAETRKNEDGDLIRQFDSEDEAIAVMARITLAISNGPIKEKPELCDLNDPTTAALREKLSKQRLYKWLGIVGMVLGYIATACLAISALLICGHAANQFGKHFANEKWPEASAVRPPASLREALPFPPKLLPPEHAPLLQPRS